MQQLDFRGLNMCTTTGLLTATGAETVYDTTATIQFCINGKAATKAAVTDGATPVIDGVTGVAPPVLTANMARMAVWCLNASGAVSVVHGGNVAWDGSAAAPMPPFPYIPDDRTPFAYQFLKAGSTAGTITFGTSNWNATGFTNAIQNVLVLPEHPQIS
jgi:hypothetical protein